MLTALFFNKGEFMIKDFDKKKSVTSNDKTKTTSRNASNNVLDTAGGEMPDPPKMPSKTKFHTGEKTNFSKKK